MHGDITGALLFGDAASTARLDGATRFVVLLFAFARQTGYAFYALTQQPLFLLAFATAVTARFATESVHFDVFVEAGGVTERAIRLRFKVSCTQCVTMSTGDALATTRDNVVVVVDILGQTRLLTVVAPGTRTGFTVARRRARRGATQPIFDPCILCVLLTLSRIDSFVILLFFVAVSRHLCVCLTLFSNYVLASAYHALRE